MYSSQNQSTIERFFAGITEQTFQTQLGVTDTQMIDYLTNMLVRFVRTDVVYRIRDLTGHQLYEVVEMLLEAEQRVGDARREVHRHVGDFILFWAGLYPESIRRMRGSGTKDRFVDYCSQGKRAYHVASTIPTDTQHQPDCEVLERLSSQFELCAYGLGEVRREWERREGDEDGIGPFLIN